MIKSFAESALIAMGGALIGWILAHSVVARECERLGAFYVGSVTYKCANTRITVVAESKFAMVPQTAFRTA